jgi:hypothetical protein
LGDQFENRAEPARGPTEHYPVDRGLRGCVTKARKFFPSLGGSILRAFGASK